MYTRATRFRWKGRIDTSRTDGDQKTCRLCGATKHLSQYRKHAGYWDGKDNRCSACLREK